MARKQSGSQKRVVKVRLHIKEIAESQGRDKMWLSHHAEIQYDTVRGIWNNPYRDCSITTLARISIALNVPISQLYEVIPEE
jgi:Cro/C1-type helix-turn-helix DNA-binding protein